MTWEDCVNELLPENIREECLKFCRVTPSWHKPQRGSLPSEKDESKPPPLIKRTPGSKSVFAKPALVT